MSVGRRHAAQQSLRQLQVVRMLPPKLHNCSGHSFSPSSYSARDKPAKSLTSTSARNPKRNKRLRKLRHNHNLGGLREMAARPIKTSRVTSHMSSPFTSCQTGGQGCEHISARLRPWAPASFLETTAAHAGRRKSSLPAQSGGC